MQVTYAAYIRQGETLVRQVRMQRQVAKTRYIQLVRFHVLVFPLVVWQAPQPAPQPQRLLFVHDHAIIKPINTSVRQLVSQMFDKLEASAYRCKKERSVSGF